MVDPCKHCLGVGEVPTQADDSGVVRDGGVAPCPWCSGAGYPPLTPGPLSEQEKRVRAAVESFERANRRVIVRMSR